MKLSKDELLKKLKDKMGEDTSDEAIALFEDISDTINDYEEKTKDSTEWERKYKENDEMWRNKYRDRFFNSDAKEEDPAQELPDDKIDKANNLKFEDLFSDNKNKE